MVDFFTKPKLFRNSGARIPKGVLLCGPPGALSTANSKSLTYGPGFEPVMAAEGAPIKLAAPDSKAVLPGFEAVEQAHDDMNIGRRVQPAQRPA